MLTRYQDLVWENAGVDAQLAIKQQEFQGNVYFTTLEEVVFPKVRNRFFA